MVRRQHAIACMAAILMSQAPAPAMAEQFVQVTDEARFLDLIEGRELRRFGIRLEVTPSGEIAGRGFGYRVTGDWEWRDAYFCRTMAYGNTEIPHNCQVVAVRGEEMRFVSDRGQGEFADFTLQ